MKTGLAFLLTLSLTVLLHSAVLASTSSNGIQDSSAQNAFQISVQVKQLDNVPGASVYAQINDKVFKPVDSIGSGPFSIFFQEEDVFLVSVLHDKNQVTSNNSVFLNIFNSQTNELIAKFNISQQIVQHFPATTNLSPFKLWPSYSLTVNSTVDDINAVYFMRYEGVLVIDGVSLKIPLWALIAIPVGSIIVVSALIASIDICIRPPYSVSGCAIWTGNLLWLIFGGLQVAMVYLLAGIVLCISIIFAPFGVALIRIAVFQFAPFGREIRPSENSSALSACSFIGNVIWFIFFGLPLVLSHLILGVVLCVLLVTIPFGLQHFKLARIALMPFGHEVVYTKNDYGYSSERAPLNPRDSPLRYA